MEQNKSKRRVAALLRSLPFVVCLGFILSYLLFGRDITVETILGYVPASPFWAAVFLLFLHAVKSLSIFFPILILQVVGGFLFPPVVALIVNTLGVIVDAIIPYGIGRTSGKDSSKKLEEKHPKLAEIVKYQQGKGTFMAFFLRVVYVLPGDVVGMYLGAIKVDVFKYIAGSVLGSLPGLITATLLGTSITDPSSPMFIVSLVLLVGSSVVSIMVYYIWIRAQKKKSTHTC